MMAKIGYWVAYVGLGMLAPVAWLAEHTPKPVGAVLGVCGMVWIAIITTISGKMGADLPSEWFR